MHAKDFLSIKKEQLLILLIVISAIGLLTTTFLSYYSSVNAIKKSIVENELPLTSDNVFSVIRRDLIEPTLISSMIANDTFLHQWTHNGEQDVNQVTQYLSQIKSRYQANTSFFISERSRRYYYAEGVLKTITKADPHDDWYFDLSESDRPYETIVDTDQANQNQLTIFINYKVFDHAQNYLGVGGLGLTVHGLSQLVKEYQARFQCKIAFTDQAGNILLTSNQQDSADAENIQHDANLSKLAPMFLGKQKETFEYRDDGSNWLLNVRYLPELDWYVLVEKNIDQATQTSRDSLYVNLAVVVLSLLCLGWLLYRVVSRHHSEMQKIAVTDSLTGLPNRNYLDATVDKCLSEVQRNGLPISMMLIDADNFKQINDQYGHLAGDAVLSAFANTMQDTLRASDWICRWGGEEFLVLLKNCDLEHAGQLAEKVRLAIEALTVPFEQHDVKTTVSIGLSQWHALWSFDQWLHHTDQALMQAKRDGRNRVVYSDKTK